MSSREAITRRIRDAVDIVELIGAYVRLRPAGASLKGLCPFHNEKTPSFNVHPAKQIFKCFGCGAGGDVFTFLQLRERVDFLEARRMLAERAGISLDDERAEGRGDARNGATRSDLAKLNKWAAAVFRRNLLGPAGAAARDYVHRRGLSPAVVEAFGLGLAFDSYDGLLRESRKVGYPDSLLLAAGLVRSGSSGVYDTFRNRLMFPIVDSTDRVVGFGGRTLGDDPAKYINTPQTALFDKGRGVFGLHRAKHAMASAGRGIVVEGYTDCMMAHQHGFAETIATLGTAFTDEQAQLLRRHADTVVLVFDSDEAGQRAADRALSVSLLCGLDVHIAAVPSGKDPCDFLATHGADAFATLLKQAPSALEFKWRQVAGRYRSGPTGPAQRRAIHEFVEQVASWFNAGAVDDIQRGWVANQVGKLLALSPAEVNRLLSDAIQRLRRPRPGAVSATSRGQSGPAPATATPAAAGEGKLADAIQVALRHVLEVLVNEPALADRGLPVLASHRIEDAGLAEAAGAISAWCMEGRRDASPDIRDLIGRSERPEFAQVITDLQQAGELRGNYEATLDGAVDCIRRADEAARAVAAGRELRGGSHGGESDQADRGEQDRALRTLSAGVRQRRGFVPLAANRQQRIG